MKNFFKRHLKVFVMVAVVASLCAMTTIGAFAEGTADTTVTTAFTSLADNVKATLAAIAALGVAIMGTFLAWKYGKKIFNKVAN